MTLDTKTKVTHAAEHIEKAASTLERMNGLFTSKQPATLGRLKGMAQLIEAHLSEAMQVLELQVVDLENAELVAPVSDWNLGSRGYRDAVEAQTIARPIIETTGNVVKARFGGSDVA